MKKRSGVKHGLCHNSVPVRDFKYKRGDWVLMKMAINTSILDDGHFILQL